MMDNTLFYTFATVFSSRSALHSISILNLLVMEIIPRSEELDGSNLFLCYTFAKGLSEKHSKTMFEIHRIGMLFSIEPQECIKSLGK
jgi:hypothetical protein